MAKRREPIVIGQRYGAWLVLAAAGVDRHGIRLWACRCSCGHEAEVRPQPLRRGSGGCERCGEIKRVPQRFRHGDARSRLYHIWQDMWQRCTNPKLANYRNYGGKGISVCEAWRAFPAFRDWAMANGYNGELTIDREQSVLNYEPGNCRWLSRHENMRLGAISRWDKHRAGRLAEALLSA